ncbi:MAG: flagellin FliC [Myxococcales bacterium]|nr:flagellin FliC [Myxococcales bacterium]
MGMSILTNTASLTAQRNLTKSQGAMTKNIGRLSSGLRINSAADDSAGLGISENLKSDIRGLAQASRNANDAISLGQVAEGAMNEQQGIVTRMRELAVQASNGTLGSTERGYIDTEFDELSTELNRISNTTEFNGQKLLEGSASAGLTMQVGFQNTSNDRISMSVTRLVTSSLGSTSLHIASASLSTATNAQLSLGAFDKAIEQLSSARAKVGSFQNRATITISNLSVAHENLSAANSRIRDVDVASEAADMTKNQILTQAGISVLSQANSLPSSALALIG